MANMLMLIFTLHFKPSLLEICKLCFLKSTAEEFDLININVSLNFAGLYHHG